MTASRNILFDVACAFPVRSQVVAFIAITGAACLYTPSILWLDGERRERK